MAYLGTILGQLTFGFFVDRYGRKYGKPTVLVFNANRGIESTRNFARRHARG